MTQVHHGDGAPGATVVEQAQEKVQEKAGEARGALQRVVREQVDTRSGQAAEQIQGIVDGLRRTGHGLRSDGKDGPANAIHGIADRSERVAQYLGGSSAENLLHDVEHFGRRNPWLVIAGGVALGVAASRLLKASSSRRFDELTTQGYNSRTQQRPMLPPPAAPVAPPASVPVAGGVR